MAVDEIRKKSLKTPLFAEVLLKRYKQDVNYRLISSIGRIFMVVQNLHKIFVVPKSK